MTAGGDGAAVCVFAVCRTGDPACAAGVTGHAGGGSVGLLALPGGLWAVAQPVPGPRFSEEALRRRLADPAELEACARAHHAVVTAAAAAGPVVPLPLATLFAGPDRAVRALAEQRERFLAALDRVAGRTEWAVKVHLRSGAPSGAGRTDGAAATGRGAGADYLSRVRSREHDRRARYDAALRAAREVYDTAASYAVAAVRRRPHGTEITGRDAVQVLNAAFLVDDGRAGELAAAVRAFGGDAGAAGIHVEVSGPWAPYSFVGGAVS